MKKMLLKHVGNMGDLVFFVLPVLETLKRVYPGCHITLVTAWGYKYGNNQWGKRNQDGFCINLLLPNPHIDQLVHWHDTKLSLAGDLCVEEGKHLPTWNRVQFERERATGTYDLVAELDFGLKMTDNPIQRVYEAVHLPQETYSNYQLQVTPQDREVAEAVMKNVPRPRIVLLEGLARTNTLGWDPAKVPTLEKAITSAYGIPPLWFGAQYVPAFQGRRLTLRENIATLLSCDVAIGVLSGPLHFAAALGLPTLILYADQPLHRGAPAFFLNRYIHDPQRRHRTLLGPSPRKITMLKSAQAPDCLTPQELKQQNYDGWGNPGRQATKSALAPITVEEVMSVLQEMI
jgi:ADP-heptose:LPS heptosyltransferase